MNRNGRRIALSMVAIVLGAGYLMKVIPPETDIGLNDSHSISIDGALVTNPLHIGEAPHRFPSTVLSVYPNPDAASPLKDTPESHEGETSSTADDLDPIPPFSFVSNVGSAPQSSKPGEASEPVSEFPSEFNPRPSQPDIGEVAMNNPPVESGSPANPSGGNPPPASPPTQNPGNNPGESPIVVTPPPQEEVDQPNSPPNIELPSDPQSPGSKGPDIDLPKYPDIITDPLPSPDSPVGPDLPSHQVPDSGSLVAILSFSLAFLAVLKRRLVGVAE